MNMDAATLTLLGVIGVNIIAALALAAVQIINAAKVSRIDARIDTVAADAAVIKGHVNSEKTAAEGRQRLLENENKLLKEQLVEKAQTAGLLAQAVAQRTRVEPVEGEKKEEK